MNVSKDISIKPHNSFGIDVNAAYFSESYHLEDLKELALASGLGLRYDFGFFVARLDTGFKIHNPALSESNRWFKESNFANAVFNIGINYPF